MAIDIPTFETQKEPASKYEKRYAVELFRHIMSGGSFESFICGDKDENGRPNGKPAITKRTLYNWMNEQPDFAHARYLAEAKMQSNVDKTIYALGMGAKQKKVVDPITGEILVDPENANPKLLMFLAAKRFRHTYSEKMENVLSNPDGSRIGTPEDLSKLTDDELEAYIALTRKINGVETTDA